MHSADLAGRLAHRLKRLQREVKHWGWMLLLLLLLLSLRLQCR